MAIAPEGQLTGATQRYQGDMLILETDLATEDGTIRLTDFMPIRDGDPVLIRIVTGIAGSAPTVCDTPFRFDYGRMAPWITRADDGVAMHVGPDRVTLKGPGEVEIAENAAISRFSVDEGDRLTFILDYSASHERSVVDVDAGDALERTRGY